MLAKRNIKRFGLPPRKISSLHPVKEGLGLRGPGVYTYLASVYIGQTGRSTETRIKEHHWHIRLGHPEILTVA